MSYETLIYAREGDVVTVTLDRPERMNALSRALRRELTEAMRRAGEEARAVVLTGAGPGFCAGQDLREQADRGLDVEATLRDEYEPMLQAIYGCPAPTIAAVNGVAAGAGANLALACDVVIAARSASFVQAFARIGLIPDAGGTWWLPRQVGFARAMGAVLFAEPVGAEQAAEWGMIWQAVPDEELEAVVRARAAALAAGPTAAYRMAKQALRGSVGDGMDAQLALEARLQKQAGATRDFAEGVRAFIEKRPPRFEGR
jgi:2-(1,2-epoxy-1,2-dihydrophenyl)acetyl-CoA isomerase